MFSVDVDHVVKNLITLKKTENTICWDWGYQWKYEHMTPCPPPTRTWMRENIRSIYTPYTPTPNYWIKKYEHMTLCHLPIWVKVRVHNTRKEWGKKIWKHDDTVPINNIVSCNWMKVWTQHRMTPSSHDSKTTCTESKCEHMTP